uniref:Protein DETOXIFICATION n=1 Tax=Araucaria cunninghamii TaxID=56994 RepID=A0A0D6QR75_ARACU
MERHDSIQAHGCENHDMLKEPLIANNELIFSFGDRHGVESNEVVDPSDDVKCNGAVIWEEVRKQCWIAGPMVAVNLLQCFLQLISVMMVGHLDELALSSASIATSFAGVSGFSVLMGMASALETLCGQSYGAKQYHMLGIHTQRAIVALLCVSIPLAVVWAYMGQILTAIGQDPSIAFEAGKFARWMIPSLFAYAVLQPLVKFLQTQSIVFPMMFGSAIALCFHVPICWALVFKTGLGNKGAALADSISNWVNVALLALYIKLSPSCKKTWTSFTKESLHDIKHFLQLAVPSAVMICLEFWSFQMLILLSGLLPNPKLETSVLSICLNTVSLSYRIPIGFGAAVSTRVSNELGAGHSRAAHLAVYVMVFMVITETAVIACTLFSMRNVWGYAFSNEREVVDYVASMMPLLAVSTIMDGIQGALSGVARGCGWQKLGAYVNLGAYYMVGIPVAVTLAFVLHMGGKGLWLGIVCGLFTQTILLFILTLCTDWEEQEDKNS